MTDIVTQVSLDQAATGGQTGTVNEPSIAVSGKRMLMAGNWFSSRSTDTGVSWSFVDPFTALPPSGAGVCCDQLVHYSRSRRLWIWLLQFRKTSNGNLFRIAVSSTAAAGTWTWWDTTPTDVDMTLSALWFDYPDLVETHDHLLLSFNLFDVSTDRWQRAAVLRFSLDALKARGPLPREAWLTDLVGSLRFARGPGDSAVFASHSGAASGLAVFEWDADDDTVNVSELSVSAWNRGPYLSQGPDGAPWLNRLDDRVTGGWRANGQIGFAWCASADAGHPEPYVRIVRLDEATKTLVDEPDLWSLDCAWAYPVTIANRRGDIGLSAFCGGSVHQPVHAVGSYHEANGEWDMATVVTSSHSPRDGVWGDYIDIQPDPRRRTYWQASGFTLQGGSTRHHVVPHIVTFKP